jgi:hypothetical protein
MSSIPQGDRLPHGRRWVVPGSLGLFAVTGFGALAWVPSENIELLFYLGFAGGLSASMFALWVVVELGCRRSDRWRRACEDAIDRMSTDDAFWRAGGPGG